MTKSVKYVKNEKCMLPYLSLYGGLDKMASGINKFFMKKKHQVNASTPRNINSANQINRRSAMNELRARTSMNP